MGVPLKWHPLTQPPVRFRGNADGNYYDVTECGVNGYGCMSRYNFQRDYCNLGPRNIQREQMADQYLLEVVSKLVEPGSTIVELGCNVGNNLLALAKKGYRMFGLDLAYRRLDELMSKAKEEGLENNVTVARWDFVEDGTLPWPELKGKVKAMVAVHVFPHLSSRKLVETVSKLKAYLAPGAPMISTHIMQGKLTQAEMEQRADDSTLNWLRGGVAHSRKVIKSAFKGFKLDRKLSRPFQSDEPVYPGLEPLVHALHWFVHRNAAGEPSENAEKQDCNTTNV